MTKHFTTGAEDMARRRVKRVALAGGAANAFAFTWENPEDKKIVVVRLTVDITTAGGTATSVLDAGSGATAATHSDNLIDGADLNAVAVYDNIGNKGSNGKTRQKLDAKGGTTSFITGQILTEKADNLAGYVYIEYFIVED